MRKFWFALLALLLITPAQATDISKYPSASTLGGSELVPCDQGSPLATYKCTPAQIATYVFTILTDKKGLPIIDSSGNSITTLPAPL